jgi:hypothetical protein
MLVVVVLATVAAEIKVLAAVKTMVVAMVVGNNPVLNKMFRLK